MPERISQFPDWHSTILVMITFVLSGLLVIRDVVSTERFNAEFLAQFCQSLRRVHFSRYDRRWDQRNPFSY
jgi:hypothetical protein